MFFRRRPKHVEISAQIVDEWSFHVKAESAQAFTALSDWLGIIQASNEGGAVDESPRPRLVGFGRTPNRDLGESESDTQIAEPDTEDEDGDDDE